MTRRPEQFTSNRGHSISHSTATSTPARGQASTTDQSGQGPSSAITAMSSSRGNPFGNDSYAWINSPNHRRHRHPELVFTEQQALTELCSPTRSLLGSFRRGRQSNQIQMVLPQGAGTPAYSHGEDSSSTQPYTPTAQPANSSRGPHPTTSPLVIPCGQGIPQYHYGEQPSSCQSYTTRHRPGSFSERGSHPTSSPLVISHGHGIPVYSYGEWSTSTQPYTPKVSSVGSSSHGPYPTTSPLVIPRGHGIPTSQIPTNPFTHTPNGTLRSPGISSSSWKSSTKTYTPPTNKDLKKKTPKQPWPETNPFADPLPMSTIMAQVRSDGEYPQRMSRTQRPQSRERLERELRAREVALEQDRKLQKARAEYHQLRVSSLQPQAPPPSIPAVATRSTLTPIRSINCWPFWVSFLVVQVGGFSTAAAGSLVINNRKHEHSTTIDNGIVFWLVVSIFTTISGCLYCLIIVATRRQQFCIFTWVSATSDVEVENTPSRPPEPDIEREVGLDAHELDTRPTPERRRAMHAQLLDEDHMPIVRPQLRDPMWYALYSRPERVPEYVACVEPPFGNSELLNRANSDIGVQGLRPSYSKNKVFQQQTQIYPPPLAKVNPAKFQDDHECSTPSPSASLMPAKRPVGAARYFGSSREEMPVGYASKRGIGKDEVVLRSEDDNKLGSVSRRSIIGSELCSFSPLEDLARDLNRKEVLEMPAKQRVEYLAQRKRQSEERSMRTRNSLIMERTESRGIGRWPTVSMYGMVDDENENGIELATLKEHEGYLADVNSEQNDDEENRARCGMNMQSEGKVQRLRRMWEEGETYRGSMGSRSAS